jgi:hypothetical protein
VRRPRLSPRRRFVVDDWIERGDWRGWTEPRVALLDIGPRTAELLVLRPGENRPTPVVLRRLVIGGAPWVEVLVAGYDLALLRPHQVGALWERIEERPRRSLGVCGLLRNGGMRADLAVWPERELRPGFAVSPRPEPSPILVLAAIRDSPSRPGEPT